ncbi:ABC transporter substrate-binding protein [Mycoplasmatota bacterium]|nr:ABC transporter substrate-binding protein [Mycoplasmatota bacterium]
MKKYLITMTLVLTIVFLTSCSSGPTLSLYNWGEYIDDALVEAFEEESGIKVKQIAFDSNEVAITQIKAGNQYDLVIPSDYAIEQLAEEDLIDPIDWSKIEAFDKDVDLATGLTSVLNTLAEGNDGFDLLSYAVPYFWGNVGILYDTTVVDENDLTGWDVLNLSDTYEVAFYNSSRDAFMSAMFATNTADINNPSDTELDLSYQWLDNALTENTYVITDDIFDAMLDPARYNLAVSFSGDANFLMMENENLSFYVPEEGTNVWVDGFVMPKGAQSDYAYEFINFMMSYDSSLQNTDWVAYTSPRQDVIDALLLDGYDAYEASFDVKINENDQVYRYNEDLKLEIDDSWQQILANKGYDEEGIGTTTIIAIALGVSIVLGTTIYSVIKKKRKTV